MLEVLPHPRKDISKYAPKIISFEISTDKIREVIGSGGKVINQIIDECGVQIDIDDNGKVSISTLDGDIKKAEKAKGIILSITRDVQVGDMYIGTVARILSKMGAFVELSPNKDGMIHISKMSKERIESVESVLSVGDTVKVEVIKVGEKGVDLRLLEKLSK